MNVSVEITMYPLHDDYEPPILDFIEKMRQHEGIEVRMKNLSTELYGEYDLVWSALQQEIKHSFNKYGKASFVMKVLQGDLRNLAG